MAHSARDARHSGFSLIEVLVALALLTVGLLAAVRLFTASTRANAVAKTTTRATILALDKMEQLRALSIDDPALQPSPPDALTSNIDGYSDRTPESFARRWSVEELPSYPEEAIAIRVAVTAPNVTGRTVIETVKVRKPAAPIVE